MGPLEDWLLRGGRGGGFSRYKRIGIWCKITEVSLSAKKNLVCLFIFDLSFMPGSTFQPSLMSNSWCLDDPYGIIQQFCAENASVGDNTADVITDNGVSVVAASAVSPSSSDNSIGVFFDQVRALMLTMCL